MREVVLLNSFDSVLSLIIRDIDYFEQILNLETAC